MAFTKRSEWGAKGSLRGQDKFTAIRVRGLVIHHSVTPSPANHSNCAAAVRGIEASQRNKGYATVAYNYLVCNHGHVFEGRPFPYQSAANGGPTKAATTRNNATYAAVCWIGDGRKGKLPSVKARHAIQRVRLHLLKTYGYDARPYIPHSKVNATACPGGPLKKWIAEKGPEF